MTIKMRLDTESLRQLIANNPEIEIELGKEVLNNIKQDLIKSNIEKSIQNYLDKCLTESGTWSRKTYALKEPLASAVQLVVESEVVRILESEVKKHVVDLIKVELKVLEDAIREEMQAKLEDVVTSEMAKEILKDKFLM